MVRASVVLPTYNRASVLPRAIDSVLTQTFSDFELIVVDDASTDATQQVVSRYDDSRVTYLAHETNQGASAARNTGIEAADGDYLFFLDSDDMWAAEKMRKQIDRLEAGPNDVVAVHCDFTDEETALLDEFKRLFRLLLGTGTSDIREGQERVRKDLLTLHFRLGGSSTLLVRQPVVDAVDGFDERFPRHQDWEFLIRVLRHGKLGYVDEPLVHKYETGAPNADTYHEAKKLFVTKFDDDIARLDVNRDEVVAVHQYALAKRYFREGQFSTGVELLQSTTRLPVEYPSILLSLAQGFLHKGSQLYPLGGS